MTKLNPLQEHWDNDTLTYDLEQYNWPAWALPHWGRSYR